MTEERGEEQSAGAIVACGGRLQWLSGRKLNGKPWKIALAAAVGATAWYESGGGYAIDGSP